MNTSAMESKVSAFKILHQISENLGSSFAACAESILPTMISHLSYTYSKAIRKFAMKTCVSVLHSVGAPLNAQAFQSVLYHAFLQLIQTSVAGQDLKNLKTILKHFWLLIRTLNEDKA